MIRTILLIILAEMWNAAGQISFKKGTNSLKPRSLRGIGAHVKFIKKMVSHPAVWLGFGAMAGGFFIWLIALSGADLSVVSPLGSVQYILILCGAHIFLGEKIDPLKLAGTLLVVAGIVLVAIS